MRLNTGQNILADIDLSAGLTEQQAEQIYAQGKEAVVSAIWPKIETIRHKMALGIIMATRVKCIECAAACSRSKDQEVSIVGKVL
jgi:hypothetical protein